MAAEANSSTGRTNTRPAWRLKCGVVFCAAALVAVAGFAGAQAQQATLPGFDDLFAEDPDAQMLLEANELVYDFDRNVVTAEGEVNIYYRGYTVESDRVIYDQNTRRVFARGNVRVTEPDGSVMYAETIELTDDFREGFVEQLTLVTTEDARFAAISAERVEDNLTIFTQGVYTACEPCLENPAKPPVWQIKAARIIHDQQERVVYYENASFEVLGVPIAYVPFFQHPDPTVRRQSGFLAPEFGYSSRLGASAKVPYFFALAPNYDLTVAPTAFTKQGAMGEFEWRHRLTRGAYVVRGAGLKQANPEEFSSPGDREWRGFVRALGEFEINEFWRWGFDGRLTSDTTFQRNYDFASGREYRNQVYLTGQSAQNWFDARVLDYRSLVRESEDPLLPTVHPVIDHNYIFGQPVLGGRLSVDTNVLSLSREEADFVNIRPRVAGDPNCGSPNTFANWANRAEGPDKEEQLERLLEHCGLIGMPGNYSRFVSQATWEATYVDRLGQVFTPFAWVRGDLYALNIDEAFADRTGGAPVLDHFLPTGSSTIARGMPAAGLEYRFPILVASSWGRQIIEPTAQIIARPDEAHAAEIPNEDAQSLIFDDTILFARDKFSGYDRVEGGTRANLGVRYSLEADNGMSAGAVFGQSYHLAGDNPFPLGSGLETSRSDFVAAAYVIPFRNLEVATRLRFDERDLTLRRQELEARATIGPVGARAVYSEINADPAAGLDFDRRELQGSATLRLTENWRVFGAGRMELEGPEPGSQWISNSVGFGYIDECISLALAYERRYVRDGDLLPDERITFRFNLRTVTEGQLTTQIRSRD